MIQFLFLRLVRLAITLLACSFVVYGALYIAPGGVLGAITGGRVLPEADRQRIIELYHLNDPFLQRYLSWLGDAVHGNLGTSLVSREPVMDLIQSRLATTTMLVTYSSVLIVVFGVGLGLLAGTRGGWVDRLIVASMSAFAAVPAFVASSILLFVFSVSIGAFPSFGSGEGFVDKIYHLTLPSIALALAAIGYVGRISRSAVIEERSRDHVQTAVSRGLSSRTIVQDHVLRNSLVPISTSVGITVASLIAGSVIVEQVFALDGLGRLLLTSVSQRDFAVVQAVTLVLVTGFVIINAVVDLLYPMLDPRMRKVTRR